MDQLDMASASVAEGEEAGKSPLLQALGERVRNLRARRGLTRRSLASSAQVSERHLANLEYGTGNVSILVLEQIAQALQCSMAELLGDVTASSAEWLLLRELLEGRGEADLRRVRLARGEVPCVGKGCAGQIYTLAEQAGPYWANVFFLLWCVLAFGYALYVTLRIWLRP